MLMPRLVSLEEFEQTPHRLDTYMPAVKYICQQHGISFGSARLFDEASAVAVSLDERIVIKIFYPSDRDHAQTEAAVLAFLQPIEGLPTPRLWGQDDVEGWPFVIMDHMPGHQIAVVWEHLGQSERLEFLEQLAAHIKLLHGAAVEGLRLPWPSWNEFLTHQQADCLAHHTRTGLDYAWCHQIPAFIERQNLLAGTDDGTSLLHTEVMPQHVLVSQNKGAWQISGLVDFEPAMIGHPDYEWAAVALFFTRGQPGLLGAFLQRYGYDSAVLDPRLQERLMGYLLLHRYSRLPWYFTFMPMGAEELTDLARLWFTF